MQPPLHERNEISWPLAPVAPYAESHRGRPRSLSVDRHTTRHHDAFMRTTLTLDPDVAQLLEEERHRRHTTFKQVVNDALRRGLRDSRRRSVRKYQAPVFHAELAVGVDPAGFNRLADELEAEAVIKKIAH